MIRIANQLEIYDTIQINTPEIKVHPLYNIYPISPSGKDVESLTSFLLRLSNIHCISMGKLTRSILMPTLKIKYSRNPYNRFSPPHLNAFGKLTTLTLNALESLCDLRNISSLVLKNFESAFCIKNLARNQRAWCPECLLEMKLKKGTIYEKLIWNLNKYQICIKHNNFIQTTCYECGKEQEIIPYKAQNGYCQYCNCWLGNECNNDFKYDNSLIEVDQKAYFKSKQIEKMLEFYFNNSVDKENIFSSLKKIYEHLSGYMLKKELCENYLGIPIPTFMNYCKGVGKLSLDHLLEISWRLRVSIVEIMEDRDFNYTVDMNSNIFGKRQYNHKTDAERVEKSLKAALESPGYIPLTMFEKNVSINTINTRFPELIEKIKVKNNLLRKQYGKKIEIAYSLNHEEINSYLIEVMNSNKIIRVKDIAIELGVTSSFLIKRFPKLINKIEQKNRLLMLKRTGVKKFNNSVEDRNKENSLDEYKEKLLEILHAISDEPKYIYDILNELGKSQAFIKYFPDIFNNLNYSQFF